MSPTTKNSSRASQLGRRLGKILTSKPAVFIYGFVCGWISYMLVLVAVMRAWG